MIHHHFCWSISIVSLNIPIQWFQIPANHHYIMGYLLIYHLLTISLVISCCWQFVGTQLGCAGLLTAYTPYHHCCCGFLTLVPMTHSHPGNGPACGKPTPDQQGLFSAELLVTCRYLWFSYMNLRRIYAYNIYTYIYIYIYVHMYIDIYDMHMYIVYVCIRIYTYMYV